MPTPKIKVICLECGRKFITSSLLPECSHCNSVDVEPREEYVKMKIDTRRMLQERRDRQTKSLAKLPAVGVESSGTQKPALKPVNGYHQPEERIIMASLTLNRAKTQKNGFTSYRIAGLRGSVLFTKGMFTGDAPDSISVGASNLATIDLAAAEERAARAAKRDERRAHSAQSAQERLQKAQERARKAQERVNKLQAKASKGAAPATAGAFVDTSDTSNVADGPFETAAV